MKNTFFLIAMWVAVATLNAQEISVVSKSGETTIFSDINSAIYNAKAESTIYLPAGAFTIDEARNGPGIITKKLTLIGVGHRSDDTNPIGSTVIIGNIYLDEGSSGSALIGLYVTGNVNISASMSTLYYGYANDILVRFCNIGNIRVYNQNCKSILINQNYIRGLMNAGGSAIKLSNNIINQVINITGGTMDHNVVYNLFENIYHSTIVNNIFVNTASPQYISNNQIYNNIYSNTNHSNILGQNYLIPSSWDDVFVGPDNGIDPSSNFKLKGNFGKNAGTDGTDIGIYGGTGFEDSASLKMPRIIKKETANQTDEDGMLKVNIQVKLQ